MVGRQGCRPASQSRFADVFEPGLEARNVLFDLLDEGQNVLVVAHGNSLRSIIMEIERLTPEQILKVELETGVPRVYTYKDKKFTRD